MAATKTRRAPARSNGKAPKDQAKLAEALAYEAAIATEAEETWKESSQLSRALFRKLRPLLRKPIPEGYIQRVGVVTGKPYSSTGVRSVQIQMDRLDAVLGPENWGYSYKHSEEGKVCHVRAWIGSRDEPLVERDSHGGVNQGSTLGNIYKGSFTNAAKVALARLGPGWEIYAQGGSADFDPDTDPDSAKQQAKGESKSKTRKLPAAKVKPLEAAITAAGLTDHLPMKLTQFGASELKDLTVEQALAVYEWAKSEATGG